MPRDILSKNQKLEKYYFEKFCESFDLHANLAIYDDKPDVIYENRIGIEITNLFIQSGGDKKSEQVQAKRRELFVETCQKKFETKYNLSIEINVGFSEQHPLPTQRERIEENFTDLVHKLYIENHRESITLAEFYEINEICFLYIHDQSYDDNKWTVTQAYSTPPINTETLKRTIAEKERKSNLYKKFSENWLLIIIDNINPAQNQYIPHDFNFTYKSDFFSRILIFEKMYGRVYEIKAF